MVILSSSKAELEEAELPPIIPAAGLSELRQQYLYSQIRPHVPAEFQDELCPNLSSVAQPHESAEATDTTSGLAELEEGTM